MYSLVDFVKIIFKRLIGFAHKTSFKIKSISYYSEISLQWYIDTF